MNHAVLIAVAILLGITSAALLLGYWSGRMLERDRIAEWLWSQTPRTRPYASIVEDVELGLHRKRRP